MLTLRNLLAAKGLADAEYILDEEIGFDETVTGVGYFDYEPLLDRYHTFFPTEVIVTTLGFSGGDENVAMSALVKQMESGCAAVFIKNMLFDGVSDEVVQTAVKTRTPVFFFSAAYIEDILAELRNIFYADEEDEKRREIVDELRRQRDVPERRRQFRGATGLTGSCAACAAFRPLDELDALARQAAASAMTGTADHEDGIECFICGYADGWVLLATSDEAPDGMDGLMETLCGKLVRDAGVPLACGMGDAVATEDVDLSITQALQAAAAPGAETTPARWRDLGWTALAGAARESELLATQCARLRGVLEAHDEETGSDLVETLRTFVQCGGVVQATAEALYLHPNSVRNRVVKAAKLLGMENEPERNLFAYFVIIFLSERQRRAGSRLIGCGLEIG